MDNFQTLETLFNNLDNHFSEVFCLWPVSAFLCKYADEQGWPISAAVRRIAAKHPFKVDQDPSTIASEKAEAEYLQKRAVMVSKVKTEIQKLYIRANEAEVMSRMRDGKQGKEGQR